jgi:hypothetical protein
VPALQEGAQFDPLTNNLGMLAGVFFAAMVLALVMGNAPWTPSSRPRAGPSGSWRSLPATPCAAS